MRNRFDPKPYEIKIQELHKLVEKEALELQNIKEAKDSSLRDIQTFVERKSLLIVQIGKLEEQIKERERVLSETIERKVSFVESIKKERERERESLRETQKFFQRSLKDLENLTNVSNELKGFISKSSQARTEYIAEQEKLGRVKSEYEEVSPLLAKEKEETEKEKRELDEMKNYMSDFYGKISSYTKVAKETLEYVNEHLKETGTPLRFKVPEGEILEIDINNFSNQ